MELVNHDLALLTAKQAELAAIAGCANPQILSIGTIALKGQEPFVRITVYGENTHEAEKRARHLNRSFDQQQETLGLAALSRRPEIKGIQKTGVTPCNLH